MEAIVNNLVKATGWSIFNSLWQGAIIYGILILIIYGFPKIKAEIKYNLAYAAICLMFICFCSTFFSVFKIPVYKSQSFILNALATNYAQPTDYYQYLTNLSGKINAITEHVFPYLVSTYAIGVLLQIIVLSVSYRKLSRLKQTNHVTVPADWQEIFENIIVKLNLRKRVDFHLSSIVNVPLVIGYLKPVVLFPVALATQLELKQVEAILIHELSHIRRNDYLLNIIKTSIETVLFFNPFIWLSSKLINIEREHACDDLVLKHTGTPINYAHALLKLEILKVKATPPLSMAATGHDQHLYQRIKRITNMKTNYMNAKQQIFAVTLIVATIISLAWINPAKKTEKAKETKQKSSTQITTINSLKFEDTKTKSEGQIKKLYEDTAKKKRKFKIVTIDANGNKQEYNSVKDMPDGVKNEAIKQTFIQNIQTYKLDSLANTGLPLLKSGEFIKQMEVVVDGAMLAKQQLIEDNLKGLKMQDLLTKSIESMVTGPVTALDGKQIFNIELKKQLEDLKKLKEKKGIRTASKDLKAFTWNLNSNTNELALTELKLKP